MIDWSTASEKFTIYVELSWISSGIRRNFVDCTVWAEISGIVSETAVLGQSEDMLSWNVLLLYFLYPFYFLRFFVFVFLFILFSSLSCISWHLRCNAWYIEAQITILGFYPDLPLKTAKLSQIFGIYGWKCLSLTSSSFWFALLAAFLIVGVLTHSIIALLCVAIHSETYYSFRQIILVKKVMFPDISELPIN